jgi:thermostable 8-oxoguanine DNA glycosylase
MVKPTPNPPASLFTVNPDQNTETLLVNASETLSSLNALTCNLAFDLDTSQRAIMLGIQQMAELGQLLVDRALEQVRPSLEKVPKRD